MLDRPFYRSAADTRATVFLIETTAPLTLEMHNADIDAAGAPLMAINGPQPTIRWIPERSQQNIKILRNQACERGQLVRLIPSTSIRPSSTTIATIRTRLATWSTRVRCRFSRHRPPSTGCSNKPNPSPRRDHVSPTLSPTPAIVQQPIFQTTKKN